MNLFRLCSRVLGPILAGLILVGYIALGTLLLMIASCAAAPVKEQEQYMWLCFVPDTELNILGIENINVRGHRFMALAGDRNKDGRLDLLMLYEVDENGGPNSFPRYYFVDDTFSGMPTRAFRDNKQKGQCADMVEIHPTALAEREA